MQKTILIVEDEKFILEILEFNLQKEGYKTITAYDGQQAIQLFEKLQPDLILLDLMLPKIDGLEVCKRIRKSSDVPIIMLTAKDEEIDKVLGLEIGADDYLTKPFSNRELLARIKAILRRFYYKQNSADEKRKQEEFGVKSKIKEKISSLKRISIDRQNFSVLKDNKNIDLTQKELELLIYFLDNKNRLLTREEISTNVWGNLNDLRTVDVTIKRLREKIEDNPKKPNYIVTKRGLGYILRDI